MTVAELLTIPAKRDGTCCLCSRAIMAERFDVIAKVPDRGWAHVACADRFLVDDNDGDQESPEGVHDVS